MRQTGFLLLVGFYLLNSSSSFACSAFCLQNAEGVVVAKSYDWYVGHGHGAVYVSPRGIKRQAMVFDPAPNPAKWTAQYGSVTFTQFGLGIPTSGVNENGLVVEVLQSGKADYTSVAFDRPYVNEGEWAQYQLDNYGDVATALRNIGRVRVEKAFTELHYFLADQTGATATVDFVNGTPVVHTGERLPVPALTNDEYEHLLAYSARHPGKPPTQMALRLSENRFNTLRDLTARAPTLLYPDMLAASWQGLKDVRLNGFAPDALLEPSQWNIVTDLRRRKIYFATRKFRSIKSIELDKLNFAVGAPIQMADMNVNTTGDFGAQLKDYSATLNTEMVTKNKLLFALKGESRKVGVAVQHGQLDACGNSLNSRPGDESKRMGIY